MKKLTSKRAAWLSRRAKISNRRAVFMGRCRRLDSQIPPDVLVAPPYFNIAPYRISDTSEACEAFLAFIRDIRQYSGQHLRIDMSKASRLVVIATLLFKAEVSYLIARGVRVSAILPKKSRTHQVLTQTGLTTLLGLPPCSTVDRQDTVHWRHASGKWSKAQPDKFAALIFPTSEGEEGSLLYTGLIESVSNSIEHAYQDHPARRKFLEDQEGWWSFQQYRDGELSTCICDLGIGIANALPVKLFNEPSLFADLMALFRKHKGRDIQSILAAIQYGRSGTGLNQRGKGLRDAHLAIDDAGEGSLHIISNKGLYFYKRNKGDPTPVIGTKRLTNSIGGTIYYWRFPLQSDMTASTALAVGESK